ncbi:P-loop containing nucleoside triphosphate hydrolase protein [Phycomyces nitens]|nr:P-loop containing nucleoside triphosphate hydrolase protein [Phycomyces nitens]
MIPKIKHFYTTELITSLQTKDPKWVYNAKCKACTYASHCRKEATGTPGEIPYMTPHVLKTAKDMMPDDLEDLSAQLQHMSLQGFNGSHCRPDEWQIIKKSPLFEPFYEAYSTKKPIFIGKPSGSIPGHIDQDIYICFLVDPTHNRMCSYSIGGVSKDGLDVQFSGSVDTTETKGIKAHVILAAEFATNLFAVLTKMANTGAKFAIYVYESKTRLAIQECLCQLFSGKENLEYIDDFENVMSNAKECLLNLFVNVNLLKHSNALFPDHTNLDTLSPCRFVVLEDILRENIALGVPGFYSLVDIAVWMTTDFRSKESLEGISEEEMYDAWVSGQNSGLEDAKRSRIKVYGQIVKSYKAMASEYQKQTGVCIFPLECQPFVWTRAVRYSNTLARLMFFKYLELLASYEKLRTERLADLCIVAKSGLLEPTNGLLLEFVEYKKYTSPVRQYESLVGHFVVGQDSMTRIRVDSLKINTFQEYILVPASSKGILEIISYPDVLYRAKFRNLNISTFNVKSISKDDNLVVLSGYFKSLRLVKGAKYLLYRRHIDFNTDKVITALESMEAENDDSVFLQIIRDPNGWSKMSVDDGLSVDIKYTALSLCDNFAMSPSQQAISASVLKNRLQIVWGPPGSGKTEFLALFVNWYIAHVFGGCPETRPLVIGVTAFTRHAIANLLNRIRSVQSRQKTFGFRIVSLGTIGTEGIMGSKAEQLSRIIKGLDANTAAVVGGTVWDWAKVKKTWPEWAGADVMIIDESSQLLVSDSALAINCLNGTNGRLIIAGDHMQLGPILQNEYPQMPLSEPCLFGSIQECLMRTVDNEAISITNFRLQKGVSNDFGPSTIQLKDNWRMNQELNSFFQQIYGDDFTARYPSLRLRHDWSKFTPIGHSQEIKAILDPNHALTMARLIFNTNSSSAIEIETEAAVVAQIVNTHLMTRIEASRSQTPISKTNDSPHVMVVTPYHRQRVAVQRAIGDKDTVVVDTVEKMQGQECELVIGCFTHLSTTQRELDFLLDFKRWNVAVSRARCKIIIVTTDNVLQLHKDNGGLDVFENHRSAEGWGFVCLLREWAEKEQSIVEWNV